MVWVPRLLAGLLLLPGPLLLGALLALLLTLLWLPLGVTWCLLGRCMPRLLPRRYHHPTHLLFPLIHIRRWTGRMPFPRFLLLLGGVPLLTLVFILLEVIWLLLAILPFLFLYYKKSGQSWNVLLLPMNLIGALFFQDDD